MNQLHTVWLKDCSITNVGIQLLAQLPALRALTVGSFDITNAALHLIDLFSSLQTLDLSECMNVSLEGARALSERNTNLLRVTMF